MEPGVVVAHFCHPNTREANKVGLQVSAQPGLHRESWASQGYIDPAFPTKIKDQNRNTR